MAQPRFLLCVTGVVCAAFLSQASPGGPISLAGTWRFQLDRQDTGVSERWFERPLEQRLKLPGALQNQGFGDDITTETKWTGDVGSERWLTGPEYAAYRRPGNIKVPFFLQPDKHYVGVAWYQREIEIPKGWAGRRVVLTLERVHWESRVWVDGREFGTNASLCTPHVYDLGTHLGSGKHTLTLRIDNHLVVDVGAWAHSVTDHTQGNWNGVVGRLELSATTPVWLEDVQVNPRLADKSARIKVRIGNDTGVPGKGRLDVGGRSVPVTWNSQGTAETEVSLGDNVQAWDEFNPSLQKLTIKLTGDKADDLRVVRFGLRDFAAQGREFYLNGRKLFFRGTLECCIFPLTGYPPADVDAWKRLIRVCQSYGLNHIRFHSWCPPEAAFEAADELGFYFSVEIAAWTSVGDDRPIDRWLYDEASRVLAAYGNHPSFMLMPYGNEPGGRHQTEWLTRWVEHWQAADPRRLYTTASGWPSVPENQYDVTPAPRGPKGWLGKDYRADIEAGRPRRDTVEQIEVPVIVHEMGQWCVYPRLDEINKYRGPLKAKNLEIFRDSLAAHGMLHEWPEFVRASGKLQALCYKEEIEAALRTPGIGGFQLLDLHDFPGQGTALVGVLDPFWDSKGYITPAAWRRFCGPTVPLARLTKRVWTTDETLAAEVEIAHYGPQPIHNAAATWKLAQANGTIIASGELCAGKTIPCGQGTPLGRIELPLAKVPAPLACKLVVGLKGTSIENDWNLWVYPASIDTPATGVVVASAFNAAVQEQLATGRNVLLLPGKISYEHPRLTFEPIFWNRFMFNTQGRQTLGFVCNPRHPALASFPTDFFQDWQWDEIVTGGHAMVLDGLPRNLRPIVQPIDDWNSNRRLGLIWECRVGKGKLLVCSAELERDLGKRPAARQLRASLLRYINSPAFNPSLQVPVADLQKLFELAPPSNLVALGARVINTDSEDEHGNLASKAIDGDPETIWHSRWEQNDPLPHHLTIDLGREVALRGITYLPRQDMANGRIAQGELYLSLDGQTWGDPAARVKWPNNNQSQTVLFKHLVRARYMKFVALSEVNNNPFASIAELDVLPEGK